MKQIILMAGLAFVLASCNNESKDATNAATEKAATASTVELPYKLEKPYENWQIGSNENVAAAMGALKAYADKDYTALAGFTADSIEVKFDNYQQKLSRDSAVAMFAAQRNTYSNYSVNMYDYVSVISADKKTEWVTLWYKQIWTDAKGKVDSVAVVDDFKMENGKIAVLDDKDQRYQAKK